MLGSFLGFCPDSFSGEPVLPDRPDHQAETAWQRTEATRKPATYNHQ
jgi:hypothetical protein